MRVKVLSRNPADYLRETKKDIHKGEDSSLCHCIIAHPTLRRSWFVLGMTIQYNTTSFIANIEHNYIITTIFTQHWDGWKGSGQKNNLIVVHKMWTVWFRIRRGGAVAEWVRTLDWRPDGPGFESHCGKLFASELWQFRLPRFASVFRRRH